MSANFWVMRGRQASNDPKICTNDEFFPRIFKSRKVGNDICFIMTFFRIPVRKTSGENSYWNEENTVKMIQMYNVCNVYLKTNAIRKTKQKTQQFICFLWFFVSKKDMTKVFQLQFLCAVGVQNCLQLTFYWTKCNCRRFRSAFGLLKQVILKTRMYVVHRIGCSKLAGNFTWPNFLHRHLQILIFKGFKDTLGHMQ